MTRKRMSLVLALALATLASTLLYAATQLSITFSDPVVTCNSELSGASVVLDYTVTSTGATDAATVTGEITGTVSATNASYDSGTIALDGIPSGCTTDGTGWDCSGTGSSKTASGSYTATLPNGTYTFSVTATQSGSASGKTTTNTENVVVNCTAPPTDVCANVSPFGDIVGNPSLHQANGVIPIHWKGDFGSSATIEITGGTPGSSFSTTVDATQSGESCVYQAVWDPRNGNNGGPGTYTFTITGDNGNTDVFVRYIKN